MSVRITPIKKRKIQNVISQCIFCNKASEKYYVFQPKVESYLIIQTAALRRKDDITERFKSLYNAAEKMQTFSCYKTCYASYTREEKIRQREI